MKKYWIITYGCQMNKSDSENLDSILKKKGYKPAPTINEASLIVVNMCSVRQSAVDRVYGLFSKFQSLKKKNKKLKTVLTGCILKFDKKKFKNRFDEIWDDKDYFDIVPRYENKKIAYIPISNGCNNFCSYCVVPFVRGRLVCRNHKKIIKDFEKTVKKGLKEIWLLGQNVNDYISPADGSVTFPRLLEIISKIPGHFQIRFMSPNPKNFTDKLINVMAKSKKIAKFINLPVQSGDNKILKKMNRPYTAEEYKNLVKKIRKKIPKINLSTDVIVGFPGETKSQFKNTAKLLREIRFNIAYISRYSPRHGSAAFKMKDNVSLDEKKRREKILREIVENQK